MHMRNRKKTDNIVSNQWRFGIICRDHDAGGLQKLSGRFFAHADQPVRVSGQWRIGINHEKTDKLQSAQRITESGTLGHLRLIYTIT